MPVPPAKPRPEGHRGRALCAVALPTLPPAIAPAVVGPTFSQQLFLRVARQVTRFSSWLAQPLLSSVAGAHAVLQLEVASEVSIRPATTVSSRPPTAWRPSGARQAGRGPTPRVVWGPGWLCATPAWLAKPTSFRSCCRRLRPDRWATALSPRHHDRPASTVRRDSSLGRVLTIYPRHEHEGRQPRGGADASVAGRCGKHDGRDTCVAPGAIRPAPPRSTSAQKQVSRRRQVGVRGGGGGATRRHVLRASNPTRAEAGALCASCDDGGPAIIAMIAHLGTSVGSSR